MTSPFTYPAFRSLFAAQICSLLAVGLLTMALSLAAYLIGGAATAGQILGMLLALKMVAYVGFAPLAEPLLSRFARKPVMMVLDALRLLLLLPMFWANETWHLAVLAFVFFVVSAGFTPMFQSVIPDLLPDEPTYTRALVLSRVAYTLESILSPVIAASALQLVPASALFLLASVAFAGSVAALWMTRFPADPDKAAKAPFLQRALRGMSIFRATPRLRGLFLLNLALSLVLAWVLVNTVAYAGARLGDAEHYYPILMGCYGAGAAMGALLVPRLLERISDRLLMGIGCFGFAGLGALVLLPLPFAGLLMLWAAFGLASSLVLTPGGLIIARSAARADRPALFAAQFSLSHAGWLVAYPLAGWLGGLLQLETALAVLSLGCAGLALVALRQWPMEDPVERSHTHPDLPADHPHLRAHDPGEPHLPHRHVYYIDDLHPTWT